MGILLGFGEAQLLPARLADDVAQHVGQLLRREQGGEPGGVRAGILHHAGGGREGEGRTREGGKSRAQQGFQNLAGPVGAEVGEQDSVARAHSCIRSDDRGLDELVRQIRRVRVGNDLRSAVRFGTFGHGEGAVGQFHPFPALVPIHGVVTAGNRGDGGARRQGGGKGGDLFPGALGGHVAAVREDMHGNGHTGCRNDFGQGDHVILVCVHAAGRAEAHQVAGAARRFQRGDMIDK